MRLNAGIYHVASTLTFLEIKLGCLTVTSLLRLSRDQTTASSVKRCRASETFLLFLVSNLAKESAQLADIYIFLAVSSDASTPQKPPLMLLLKAAPKCHKPSVVGREFELGLLLS